MEKLYDAEKLQIFIHFFGVVFFDGLLDVQDLNLYGLGSETDLQNVTLFDGRGSLGGLAVDRDSSGVAGLIGHGAALDEARYL